MEHINQWYFPPVHILCWPVTILFYPLQVPPFVILPGDSCRPVDSTAIQGSPSFPCCVTHLHFLILKSRLIGVCPDLSQVFVVVSSILSDYLMVSMCLQQLLRHFSSLFMVVLHFILQVSEQYEMLIMELKRKILVLSVLLCAPQMLLVIRKAIRVCRIIILCLVDPLTLPVFASLPRVIHVDRSLCPRG